MIELFTVGRLLSLAAGTALLWLAVHTARAREKPAARSFAVLLGTLGVTALCAGATVHTGVVYKLVWLYTGLAIPLALAFFAFDYYGSSLFATRTRARAAVAPAVAGAVGGTLVTLGTTRVTQPSPSPQLAALPAPVFDVAATLEEVGVFYTTAVTLLAAGVVVRTVLRYDHLDTRLGPAVATLGLWPWLANLFVPDLASAFSLSVGLTAVAGGYTASAVLAAVAVGPLRLFESSPMAGNVGPEVVLDSIDDAVCVVDEGGQLLRLNTVACETFGARASAAAGGPIEGLVGRSLAELRDGETVEIDTREGARLFSVTRSTVTDRTGRERGYTLVLRDVTRQRTRRQRLDVFNRVLRHNLRNEANSILGYAQLVEDGDDTAAYADRIVDTTKDLVEVGERAREIDRIMSAPRTDATASLADTVAGVVERVDTTYPAVEVTTAVPEDAVVAAAPEVLEIVLRNLVDNAAAHNDADEPIVVVSADTAPDGLRIAVSDNGPGIPEHERAVLDAGREDPLEHGSSMGLWAVKWGVTRMGGSLSFSENDPRGSVVTLTVPVADEGGVTTDAGTRAGEDGVEA